MAGLFSPSETQTKGLLGDFRGRAGLLGYVDQLNQQQLAAMADARKRDLSAKLYDYAVTDSIPAQAVRAAYSGFTLPRDVAAGRVDPRSQEAIERSFDLAGSLTLGGGGSQVATKAGRQAAKNPNIVRMFAGPTAKTADHAALKVAKEMAESGADKAKIFKDTGWFQDIDKKWRFEIPDQKATLDVVEAVDDLKFANDDFNWRRDTLPLGGVLDHPELYKAYPEISDLAVHLAPDDWAKSHGVRGSYSPVDGGRITLKQSEENPGIALHEIQHRIQQIEGFDPGSNTKDAQKVFLQNLNNKADVQKETIKAVYRDRPEIAQKYRLYKQAQLSKNFDEMSAFEKELMSDQDGVALLDADFELGMISDSMARNEFDPMDVYRRTAGEVEARNVESRRTMTGAKRKATAPWNTEDVGFFEKITGYR